MKITTRQDGRVEVLSESGNTYHVQFCGSGDGDPDVVRVWECDCPAYQYRGRTCKHINAVVAQLDAEETNQE